MDTDLQACVKCVQAGCATEMLDTGLKFSIVVKVLFVIGVITLCAQYAQSHNAPHTMFTVS